MYEAIVTLVCAGTGDEPDYTEVHRYEFETEDHMRRALMDMTRYTPTLAGGKMGNQTTRQPAGKACDG